MFKFFKKKKKVTKVFFGHKRIMMFDTRPFYDFKDNLKYAHASVLFEEDGVTILAREYKGIMYKYTIVNDFAKYKSLNMTNEMLVAYNLGKEFPYGLKIEDLGRIKMAELILIEECSEETVRYSITYPKQTNECYQMVLVYDKDSMVMNQFQYARTYGPLYSEFKTAVYQDLGAIDKEDY